MSILASSESTDFKPIQPLHNPSLAARVVVPQAPIGNGNSINQAPGMAAKALFAKKLARKENPVVSPTDNLTPCSKKIAEQRRKYFNARPTQLFQQTSNIPQKENDESSQEKDVSQPTDDEEAYDNENPF